jgi:two-component system response regulator AlgR
LDEVSDAREAIERVDQLHPELLLVDAVLPGMSGIELARRLSPTPQPASRPNAPPVPPPAVIFVSGSPRYAVDAFEVKALDYLLKPVESGRLLQALRRVDDPAGMQPGVVNAPALPLTPTSEPPRTARRHFAVHERGRLMLVPVEQVIYLKAELKYVTVRTRQREFLIEDSLSSLEAEFGGHFVRVHRNALVARSSIAGFERIAPDPSDGGEPRWQVVLRDVSERLPVSRRQWSSLRTLIG